MPDETRHESADLEDYEVEDASDTLINASLVIAGGVIPVSPASSILSAGDTLSIGQVYGPGDPPHSLRGYLNGIKELSLVVALTDEDAEPRGLALQITDGISVL